MFLFLFLTACFVLTSADHPTTCPTGYTRFGNKCYKLLTESLTFFEASPACDIIDGRIVEITSSEDQMQVAQYLADVHATSDVWLGATDLQIEGKWLYDSSSNKDAITTYSNWAPTAPKQDQTNNCGSLSFPNSWKWMDVACTYHLQTLCYVTLRTEDHDVVG